MDHVIHLAIIGRLLHGIQIADPTTHGVEAETPVQPRMEAKHLAKLRKTPQSLICGEEHLIQICLDGSHNDETGPYFGQWILLDDLWASAHPELADALLTWCARWDLLSEW